MENWYLEKIPKTMFFYWGAPKISAMRVCSIVSFAVLNPDWRVVLMVPKELTTSKSWSSKEHRNKYQGADQKLLLEAAASRFGIEIEVVDMQDYGLPNDLSEVHKSDFLRLVKLGNEGGFYSDTDILFFRPISTIRTNYEGHKKITNLFCHNVRNKVHYIGFLGSSADNQLFKDLAHTAATRIGQGYKKLPYQAIGCKLFERLIPWQKMVAKYPDCLAWNMSTQEVYHYDHRGFSELYKKATIPPTDWSFGIGVHWFGGHPNSASVETNLQPDKIVKSPLRIGQLCNHIWELADLESLCPKRTQKNA